MLETSRLPSVKPGGTKVPQIEHPILKLAKENANDSGFCVNIGGQDGRSVPFENQSKYKPRKSTGSRATTSRSSRMEVVTNETNKETFLTAIPDAVNYVDGDPKSTRLPIFGSRSAIQSRPSTTSQQIVPLDSEKYSVEEISDKFQKRINGNYYEIRKKFIDNDAEQKGNVTREALMRILQSTTNFPITKTCLNELLSYWGMRPDKQMFNFSEIDAVFRNKAKQRDEPAFIDPVSRQKAKPLELVKMLAVDVYTHLKEKIQSRDLYLSDLFPQAVEHQTFFFDRNDLKCALNKILVDLLPAELDKLWLRLDPAKQGTINGAKFMKQLGIISLPPLCSPRAKAPSLSRSIDSPQTLEDILKLKLRKSYKKLGEEFLQKDSNNAGYVTPDDFLQVLSNHDLNLEKPHLNEFLNRCVIVASKDGIPYKEFLVRFQDRSEAGVTHRLLTKDMKKKTAETSPEMNDVSLIEMKLVNMFQKDFLELLECFRKVDKSENGVISLQDFKKVIEKNLNTEFSDSQFKAISDNLPLNRDSSVLYLDFLKQFDTGNFTPMMALELPETGSNTAQFSPPIQMNLEEMHSGKTIKEIKNVIKDVVQNRFLDLERAFQEVDEYNTNQLTQEMMYQLMKRLNTKPELSRGDIRAVWKSFILNERQMLDYKEFVRHFLYNKLTASYPNAKIFPPVKGDSDLMQRSRKLNAATDMLFDNLRSMIDVMYDSLLKEFRYLDPNGTGEIERSEFQAIIRELSLHLTDFEINTICDKFKTEQGRISYFALLQPYHRGKEGNMTTKKTKKKYNRMAKDDSDATKQLLNKLTVLNQASFKKAIRKLEGANNNQMPTTDLRAVLLLQGISLNEDELFILMDRYDHNLTGFIDFNKLLGDIKFEM